MKLFANPHSTGRLNLVRDFMDFGLKILNLEKEMIFSYKFHTGYFFR